MIANICPPPPVFLPMQLLAWFETLQIKVLKSRREIVWPFFTQNEQPPAALAPLPIELKKKLDIHIQYPTS